MVKAKGRVCSVAVVGFTIASVICCSAGNQKPGIGLLQQLVDIGSITRVSIKTRTQNAFELESVEEKTILNFCHARPRSLTRSSLLSAFSFSKCKINPSRIFVLCGV
jgi:hypothetical protein